jgi:hypothetical protein
VALSDVLQDVVAEGVGDVGLQGGNGTLAGGLSLQCEAHESNLQDNVCDGGHQLCITVLRNPPSPPATPTLSLELEKQDQNAAEERYVQRTFLGQFLHAPPLSDVGRKPAHNPRIKC